jgi:hypothetical protein
MKQRIITLPSLVALQRHQCGGVHMKMPRLTLLIAFLLVFVFVPSGMAQTKQYLRDGLSFSYPSDWPLADDSNANTQSLNLDRGQNEAKIIIVAIRAPMNGEQFAEAQPKVSESIANAVAQEIARLGGQAQRSSISETIAGVTAQGLRLRAGWWDEKGDADIFWLHLGGRLVHVVFVGSDQERSRAACAWNMVRNTLRVETASVPPPPPAAMLDLNDHTAAAGFWRCGSGR